MTNETVFDPFEPQFAPAAPAAAPAVAPRRGRPPKGDLHAVAPAPRRGRPAKTAPAPRRGRPAKTAPAPRRGSPPKGDLHAVSQPPKAAVALALAIPALVGLKATDAQVLTDVYTRLSAVSRGRRIKIVAALGRLLV